MLTLMLQFFVAPCTKFVLSKSRQNVRIHPICQDGKVLSGKTKGASELKVCAKVCISLGTTVCAMTAL